ncbi:TraB/GumN family protein [Novosphingobium sp. FSY-8]|uniref:TraB/GumN family protein n=1 Tax=Novosphingobium ovatum TaxID=1908523 RepID=A0ABW9XCT2_9SPHN|nr:TraB/GumN family protein [Novosphingobium ovatum]NBC36307.1 TraB/GumN family protein [Novosphingobium ovatum]
MKLLSLRLAAPVLSLLAMLWAPSPALADQRHPTPVPTGTIAAPVAATPALWKLQKGASTIYLFGTLHVMPDGIDWYRGPVAQAFEASDTLVTEIIDLPADQMRAVMQDKAMLPAGKTLRASLPPAVRADYLRALQRNAIPADSFDRFRPWFAAVNLSLVPLLKEGYNPANGVDGQLTRRAKDRAMKQEALETAAQQFSVFAALPPRVENGYLREVAKSSITLSRDVKRMIAAWQRGDAAYLARLLNEGEDDPVLRKALMTDRNRAWTGWIANRLNQPGTVFIAVGAGHLAGTGSVQAMLRARGITATRVQ